MEVWDDVPLRTGRVPVTHPSTRPLATCPGDSGELQVCNGGVGLAGPGVWMCIRESKAPGCESHGIFTLGFKWHAFKLLSGQKEPTMKSYFICFPTWL